MRKNLSVLLVLMAMFTGMAFSQNGYIRGTVSEDATGETVPGVTVFVEGTTKGAATDLDGKFSITLEPGTYSLKVSFVSHETIIIKDVKVVEGEVTLFDNIRLKESVNVLKEAVITAEMVRNNENALLTIKKKSPNLIDGISASNFRKIGDSNAASSIKRVPGISVSGGKYVFVRGLGDRYTKSILNGVDIPGLDPDRNTVQMDIFPTSVIDNIIVHKSFVAELPADFTGGVVDIATKAFPEDRKGGVSISFNYNPYFHFNPNYMTYEGGKTDFLGFDDGTRAIPAVSNVPFFTDAISDVNGADGARYKEILSGFNPTMGAMRKTNLMDYSVGFNFGNQKEREKFTTGYNLVFSYKNETEYYKNAEYGRYGLSGDSSITEMDTREHQVGEFGTNNVLLSGMAGFAIKTDKSKYRINLIHLQNGQSKAGVFAYDNSDQGAIFSGTQHNLEYSQRSLTNLLIDGKYYLKDSRWDLEWKISPTYSQMYDPDIRFTRYEDRGGTPYISSEAGFPQRIWRELSEVNIGSVFNAVKEYKFKGEAAKFKLGGAYTYKNRDFNILSYNFNPRNLALTGDPSELFDPANLWPYNNNPTSGTTYEPTFLPNNPNKFNANTQNIAAYMSTEVSPFKLLKMIVGLRMENYIQHYTGQDQLGYNELDNAEVINDLGFYPTVNFVYNINEKNNLRASFARTVARPSFKELSYAEIYDPLTGRTFIGGLFRDANDVAGIEYWDGNLRSTYIQNYDLRWEIFPEIGQTISTGVFYKRFNDPIEIVQFAAQAGAFQPRNVGDAEVLGAELEIRQTLKFISKKLSNYSLGMNFTATNSKIKLSKTEYESRVDNARVGQTIDEYRSMAGQAPFIINGGISYEGGEEGFWKNFEAGLFYNVQGRTLQYVGIVDRPDIYSNPFHSLNFNANKSFGKNDKMQLGIKVENILNDKTESIFRSYQSADKFFTRLEPGVSARVKFSYKFF